MSGFRFRLETPLRLARARRGEFRRELAARLSELAGIDAELQVLGRRRTAIDEETGRRITEGIDGAELARLARARGAIDAGELPLVRRHDEAAAREREIRERLAAINREVQVLEKMRDEARTEWHRGRLAREQTELDDLTLVRRGTQAVAERTGRREP